MVIMLKFNDVPFARISMGCDKIALSLVVVRHEYEPLWDCCSGINCSWLVEELEMMATDLELTTGVLPSGGPSH